MTISENDTRAYHLGDRASLGWEQTISESLRDTASPYMEALKERRAYGEVIGDLLEGRGMIRDGFRILEVGGGYGNLAHYLLGRFGRITATMVDISPVFCGRQRLTLAAFGDRATVIEADIFDYLGRHGPFDLIISNENMADFPSLVDIPKRRLIEYMEGKGPIDPNGSDDSDLRYLEQARDFIRSLDIDPQDAPDTVHLNTGAARFIELAMGTTDRLFVVEHSSDWSLPRSMADFLRDPRTDRWPKKIILFSHHEVTICFEHLKRLVDKGGLLREGGGLMDLFQIRDDTEIRYILLSGSIQTEKHEIIGEFIDHIKEYQWLLIHR
ncbi:MAG: methyltransferase domain-containing protein [Deltaproteobacteria bacterium]|nr:methyltransferase domain-containing protein [Candidatus Zymogenaceae bacterium]